MKIFLTRLTVIIRKYVISMDFLNTTERNQLLRVFPQSSVDFFLLSSSSLTLNVLCFWNVNVEYIAIWFYVKYSSLCIGYSDV